MKISFLLTRRVPDVPSPVLLEAFDLLRARGHEVDGWIPEDYLTGATTVEQDADVYLLKSHTEHALSVAGALHDAGSRVINDYHACLIAQDKVTAARRMRALGIPTPDTWLVADPALVGELVEGGPLILKPNRGHRGAGVVLVRSVSELPTELAGPTIAQRFAPGPGEDLKVYVAGEKVWAVRKTFDTHSFTRAGRPVPVSAEVYDIAQRVRRGFGLELFGIDVIESPQGPQVIDVNYFPGYKGCEEPAPQIVEVIDRLAVEDPALART